MAEKQGTRTVAGLKSLDTFLDEEGFREEVTDRAVKRLIAMQLVGAMKERKLTQTAMAKLMETSRAQLARILDPEEFNVSLDTLNRAAKAVGRQLRIELT
jgi:predicted XRE-type DNA-binding protein